MSLKSLPKSGAPFGRFFRSLRTREDFSISTAFRCLSYSWVLRSLVRIGERERREKGVGVFLLLWLAGWVLLFVWFGRGVCSSSVACPCCFSRVLPVGLRPWLRCSLHVAYVGFSCSALARLLVVPGRLLTFPRGLFLSLCYLLIYHIFLVLYHIFLVFLFTSFALIGYRSLVRRAGDKPLPLLTRKKLTARPSVMFYIFS